MEHASVKVVVWNRKNKLLNEQTLNNGVEIPQLALGTWIVDDNKVAEPVKTAIRLGYRHVDTAQAYANEVICCIKKVILF